MFAGTVGSDRPVADFTPRVMPWHEAAVVPLELGSDRLGPEAAGRLSGPGPLGLQTPASRARFGPEVGRGSGRRSGAVRAGGQAGVAASPVAASSGRRRFVTPYMTPPISDPPSESDEERPRRC